MLTAPVPDVLEMLNSVTPLPGEEAVNSQDWSALIIAAVSENAAPSYDAPEPRSSPAPLFGQPATEPDSQATSRTPWQPKTSGIKIMPQPTPIVPTTLQIAPLTVKSLIVDEPHPTLPSPYSSEHDITVVSPHSAITITVHSCTLHK